MKEIVSSNKTKFSIVRSVQWSLFYTALYFGMTYLEKIDFAPWLIGIPFGGSGLQKEIANDFVINMFITFFAGSFVFLIYYIATFINKLLAGRIKSFINTAFTILFSIVIYPLQFLFLKILFLLIRAENMPQFIKTDFAVSVIVIAGHFISIFLIDGIRAKNKNIDLNPWTKVASRGWSIMIGYFIVVFAALIIAISIGGMKLE